MIRLLVAAVALPGCAQLFGIDDTSGATMTSMASLQLNEVQIGASLVRGPADLTNDASQFFVTDMNQPSGLLVVPGTLTANDTWSADIAGNPAAEFTLPDLSAAHVWEFPVRTVKGTYAPYQHPDPQPPADSSMLALNITIPAWNGTDGFVLQAIGAWGQHQLTGAELPALAGATQLTATIPYTAMSAMTANKPTAIVGADTVLVLSYSGRQLNGVYQAPHFDQTSGTDTLGGPPLTAVTPDKTIDATIDPTNLATRFGALRPQVTTLAMNWTVNASPGYMLGSPVGTQLNAATPIMTDTKITAMYANPFESQDWQAVFGFYASEARSFTYMGAAFPLYGSVSMIASAGTGLNVNIPAGLPDLISIGQTRLTTDGVSVTLDLTQPIDISFVPDVAMNTVYRIDVYELVPGPPPVRRIVAQVLTTNTIDNVPHFTLRPSVFEAGHAYTITAISLAGGYTNAAMGDLQTVTMPISAAAMDSGVFTVVPQ